MNRYGPILLSLALAATFMAGAPPSGAAGAKKAAGAPTASPDECALRYRASLGRIAANDLPLLRSGAEAGATEMPVAEVAVDRALPGVPLFVSPPRQRSQAEISALTAAVALARSRGRSTAVTTAGSSTDRTWIAARLREDLADYLNQKPTPYLCSGVPAYVETLRSFAGRLGPIADRRAEWSTTLRLSAEKSVRAAAEAIGKAAARPDQPGPPAELRPAAGIGRTEAAPAAPEAKLDDEAGRLAAIDGLVAAAKAASLVEDPPSPIVTGATAQPAAMPRPVLAKLLEARPLVTSARPLIRDRVARLKMLAAFSDLEMLDYLAYAGPETPDPVASGIGRTLADIEAAHAADCTCGAVTP